MKKQRSLKIAEVIIVLRNNPVGNFVQVVECSTRKIFHKFFGHDIFLGWKNSLVGKCSWCLILNVRSVSVWKDSFTSWLGGFLKRKYTQKVLSVFFFLFRWDMSQCNFKVKLFKSKSSLNTKNFYKIQSKNIFF